ncbi:FecCD family ABC transporter permease [uncultured Flavonifractor sp.]|uniref:FecCD family ABC transporter permease n=1 Tax=uncultured Flavonifractor sp. TaxID=1193534 RepID=UPI002600555F|nr:iron ABC transporter permease [uncultured Flavonifractor sp.]
MRKAVHKDALKGLVGCLVLALLIFILALIAMKLGSISISYRELFEGLFVAYDKRVATIYDLRFPRIIVALLGGAALSCSGLLFQAVLKNPLADPGIIGISGGASLAASVISGLFPVLYFSVPLFAFLGGLLAFVLIYSLSWKGSLDPVRIILIGIAVAAVFTGLESVLGGLTDRTGVSVSVSGLAQLVWSDVAMMAVYSIVGLVLALVLSPVCNLLALDDKTVRGLGVNVDLVRFVISVAAVLLVSGVTAVIGVVGFLALIVPHMARRIVGSDHRILVPFCILLGGFVLLLADTVGRCIAPPNEIAASVIMSIVGGPFFIILLKRGDRHGKR